MPEARVRRLHLKRFLGVSDLEYPADCLSSGFNLIHGPNGSGKTTTSRAIEALFWPELATTDRPTLDATLDFDGHRWSVTLDAGHPRWTPVDHDEPRPPLPPAERSRSYRLALHELLAERDQAFAELIQKEAFGGLDLPAAVAALQFEDRRPNSNLGACKTFKQARQEANDLRDLQRHLFQEAEGLKALEHQAAEADQALQQVNHWQRLLDWHDAKDQWEEADRRYQAFDSRLARLTGDEADQLRDTLNKLADCEKSLRAREEDTKQAEKQLADINLGDRDEAADLLERLDLCLQKLSDLDRLTEDLKNRARAARQKAEKLDARRTDDLTDLQIEALEQLDLQPVVEWAEMAEECRAQEKAVAAVEGVLAGDEAPDASRTETIRDGTRCLEKWLTTPQVLEPDEPPPSISFWALAGLVAPGWILLGIIAHPAWFLGLLPTLGVAAMMASKRAAQPVTPTDPREQWTREYQTLGLEEPPQWEADDVRQQLDRLRRELARLHVDERMAEARHHRTAPERERLKTQRNQVNQRRQELEETLGLDSALQELEVVDLVARLSHWQQAEADAREAEQVLQANRQNVTRQLNEFRDLTKRFADQRIDSLADAQSLFARLKRREADYDRVFQRLSTARQDLKTQQRERAALVDRRRQLLEVLDVQDTDHPTALIDHLTELEQLCAQRDSYVAAAELRRKAEWKRNDAGQALEKLPAFDLELKTLSREEVHRRLQSARDRAAMREELTKEIGRIEGEVKKTKRGQDLEAALQRVDEAESELRAHRDNALASSLGDLLVNHLREQTSKHTSKVLRKGQDLLRQMTQARYDLRISATSPPAFTAYDNVTGRIHQLETLSSGTRVQLLLAVRLAFIEEQEGGGYALPLLLDELLGTTDDQRAAAVIEAVIAMSRRGRQIFYFTAQQDEIGKWLACLEDANVPYNAIPLDRTETVSLPSPKPSTTTIPAPEDLSYHDYGEHLGIPRIDPWAPVSALHLWYLMDEPELLYNALKQGIVTWGQLQVLLTSGDEQVLQTYGLARNAAGQRRLQARIKLWRSLLHLWRIGRGKEVTRSVLLDSGAVSDNFIDAVSDLADGCHGEAAAILEALRDKAVSGFRSAKLEDLESWFAAHGYLSQQEPLSAADRILKLRAELSEEVRQGLLDEETIRYSLHLLDTQTTAS